VVLLDVEEEAEMERWERVGLKAVLRRRRDVEGDIGEEEKRLVRWENIVEGGSSWLVGFELWWSWLLCLEQWMYVCMFP
jgi:hypothetical protein